MSMSTNFKLDKGIHKNDLKFIKGEPDPGFSVDRNKAVVDGTIKKYEAMREKKMKAFKDSAGERIEAVASWATSMHNGKPIDDYLGRKWMAHFRGEAIKAELQQRLNMFRAMNPRVIV